MNWVISILFLSIASLTLNSQKEEVKSDLQLNVSKRVDGFTNISIKLNFRNSSSNRIYVDRVKPVLLTILKKSEDKGLINYTSKWLNSELQIAKNMEGTTSGDETNKVYDIITGKFTDPFALKYFDDLMKSKGKYINTKSDSLAIKHWIRKKFEGILYLERNQSWSSFSSINSLPKGQYLIFYEFSNLGTDSNFSHSELIQKLNIKLPSEIGGNKKWIGVIKSDTLRIEIE